MPRAAAARMTPTDGQPIGLNRHWRRACRTFGWERPCGLRQ